MHTEYKFEDSKPPHSEYYLLPALEKIIAEIQPKTILDVGCGNGSIASHLIKKGFNVYGIDSSTEGIAYAKAIHPERFFWCDIDSVQLPKEIPIQKFDLIISTEVIEHVYSPQKFMEFCKLGLKNSGSILLSTPYHGYLKNIALSISNKMDGHFGPLWEGGHIKFWSFATLSALLEMNQFQIRHKIGCGRFPYFWKSMIICGQLRN